MHSTSTRSQNKTCEGNISSPIIVASPGRINLIGEHTDYNNGFVLPTAIDKKIYFEIFKNGCEHHCNIFSETYNEWFQFDINKLKKGNSSWENYILGVVSEILKKGKKLQGFNCKLKSELPIGAGISSSAALECGLAAGLNKLFELGFSKKELAQLSQSAENNFVGSQCGIMDQYASVMSKKNHLILLDCRSLETEFIPANFKNCKILLINTKVSHNLSESEYNNRRKECETALQIFQKKFQEVETLRDIDLQQLEKAKSELSEIQFKRVKYVLQENERVLQAVKSLKNEALQDFGKLMYQSHYGLRDLYEVSCEELDFLVAFSEDKQQILGSRMMGGGFGGCTINLIEEDYIPTFIDEVTAAYEKEYGIKPEIITVVPGEGTIVN